MEFLIKEASQILIVIAVLCTLITIITEFTKDIGLLKRIPTSLQVLVLSIVVCVVSFFAYISYAGIVFHWYFLVAVIFASSSNFSTALPVSSKGVRSISIRWLSVPSETILIPRDCKPLQSACALSMIPC